MQPTDPIQPVLQAKRSLAFRIAAVFLGLLIVLQLASFAILRGIIEDSARAGLQEPLGRGEQILQRLLSQNADHLVESTRLLASDPGFRSAVTSDNRATLSAALGNHGERLGASIALFADTRTRLRVGTEEEAAAVQPLLSDLFKPGPNQDDPLGPRVMQVLDEPIQVVTVPVKAPLTVGWVVMGLKLNDRLLTDMRQLAGVEVAVLTRAKNAPWKIALTGLNAEQTRALMRQWAAAIDPPRPRGHAPLTFKQPGGDYVGRIVPLESRPGEQTVAVLLHAVDEAVAPYEQLQAGILALSGFGALIFAIGSVLIARHITTPVPTLPQLSYLDEAQPAQVSMAAIPPEPDVRSEQALPWLGELRQAVAQDQLVLYLQPKVRLSTGEVIGAEALMRWRHPTRGLVPPVEFIPFAEQTGLIRTLTDWLLEESARIWRTWSDNGLQLELSVNLSAHDLMDADLPGKLLSILEKHRVPARFLCLEITERAFLDDPQRALQTLEQFHRMGLQLALDDFGTGYSSLAYLKQLPVDELKIDKSFVMNMHRDEQDAKIVRSTIDLAHNLGLKVVAEGLEDEQAWPLLKALSCDLAQGYWIARPMPASELPSWVASWARPAVDTPFMPLDAAVV